MIQIISCVQYFIYILCNDFILKHIFLFQVGRRSLDKVIRTLLVNDKISDSLVKGLVEVFGKLHPPTTRVNQLAEIISEIREPATKTVIIQPISDEEKRKKKIQVIAVIIFIYLFIYLFIFFFFIIHTVLRLSHLSIRGKISVHYVYMILARLELVVCHSQVRTILKNAFLSVYSSRS